LLVIFNFLFLRNEAPNPIPEKNAAFIHSYSTDLLKSVSENKTEHWQIAIPSTNQKSTNAEPFCQVRT
jgi:hypothetical protein